MLNKQSNGVWGERKKYKLTFDKATATMIEDFLAEKFLGGFPVVLSSGRGAIKLIVQEFWTESQISIFQYASQCVVEAIQSAGVTPYSRMNFTSDIVYNQWGQLDLGCEQIPFIEDSCDTFLPEGSTILRLGAPFEIWSLPKILNSRFGAIVWCRKLEDAEQLIRVRDASKRGTKKKQMLRNFRHLNKWSYRAWQASEFKTYNLSKFEYGALLRDITEWDKKFGERKQSMQISFKLLCAKYPECLVEQKGFTVDYPNHASPVLVFEFNTLNPSRVNLGRHFQILHKIESGMKPQKVLVYKFLQKGSPNDSE